MPETTPPPGDPVVTADDRHAAVAAEYGRYVASTSIDLGGVRAFNIGDRVPVGHVERGLVTTDQVTDLNQTKEA